MQIAGFNIVAVDNANAAHSSASQQRSQGRARGATSHQGDPGKLLSPFALDFALAPDRFRGCVLVSPVPESGSIWAGALAELRAAVPQRFVDIRYRGAAPDWSRLASAQVIEARDGLVRLRVERDTDLAAFFQDDFRVTRDVTLNLGLRYEYEGGLWDPEYRLPQRLDLGDPIPGMADAIDRLRNAAEANDIVILAKSTAQRLFADSESRIRGVEVAHRDGSCERIGCEAMILACNGFGGNPELVRRHIPEMAEALYFGHPGNQGDAIIWGDALGARLSDLGAYQGHGAVATPHNILITWATIMQGGIQINGDGRRFCDETRGYSEQAAEVLRQPGGFAWTLFDARIAAVARQFDDFRKAESAGAIITTTTIADLASAMRVPAAAFVAEWNDVENLKSSSGQDRYGRKFGADQACKPPLHAVKITGALFHTQGGLAIDSKGRVKRRDGRSFPNLFAAGGTAAGVSGSTAAGYLSGNGLLTATVLGRLTGQTAAEQILR